MNKYSCLLVGLGKIGMTYDLDSINKNTFFTHAKAINNHPNFELTGVVDSNKERRYLFSKHYKSQVFDSIKSSVKNNKYSIVIIAVPTDHHFKTVNQVLENLKPKIILCEKPLAYNLKEAISIVSICKKFDVKLFLNYFRRSDPSVIEIKAQINTLENNSVKGVCWYNKGLIHSCTHFIDLCEFWMGPLEKIRLISKKKRFGLKDYSIDFNIKYKKGEITFLSHEKYFSNFSVELNSSVGRIVYDYEGYSIYWNRIIKNNSIDNFYELDKKKIMYKNEMNNSQLNVLNQILNFIEKKKYYLCTGEDGLKISKKIFKSLDKS